MCHHISMTSSDSQLQRISETNSHLVEDDLQQVRRQDGRPAPVLEYSGGGGVLPELVLPVRPEEGGSGGGGGVGQSAVPAQLSHRLAVHVEGVESVEVALVHPGKVINTLWLKIQGFEAFLATSVARALMLAVPTANEF